MLSTKSNVDLEQVLSIDWIVLPQNSKLPTQIKLLRHWNLSEQTILQKPYDCHVCCCPGSLSWQVISRHKIDISEKLFYFPWQRTPTGNQHGFNTGDWEIMDIYTESLAQDCGNSTANAAEVTTVLRYASDIFLLNNILCTHVWVHLRQAHWGSVVVFSFGSPARSAPRNKQKISSLVKDFHKTLHKNI